jgi:hypothetical protein
MSKEKMPDGITQEMINDALTKGLKIKYAKVPIDDDGNVITLLVCVPDRTILGQFRRFMDSDPKKADEILIKNCLLSHKEQVMADDELFTSTIATISDLIVVRKGILKNV